MTELTQTQTAGAEPDADRGSHVANPAMFFRRWLANPLQMGSVIPSSASLRDRIVRHTGRAADEAVVEPGAGTGVISSALLRSGLPPERLIVVEIVPDMARHLRHVLPGASVIEGDARSLPRSVAVPLARPDRNGHSRDSAAWTPWNFPPAGVWRYLPCAGR
jgi:phosphatidylethanolamine/phosphatidyl-N-methylethanolamine N-methyltransferase